MYGYICVHVLLYFEIAGCDFRLGTFTINDIVCVTINVTVSLAILGVQVHGDVLPINIGSFPTRYWQRRRKTP